MPSRPDITVFFDPVEPRPEDTLTVRVRLTIPSETACDGITVSLEGAERRYRHTTSSGKSARRVYHRRAIVSQGLVCKPGALAPGVWEQDFSFTIPSDAPPSFTSDLSTIAYSVQVHVDIPWWPDARSTHPLRILTPHRPAAPGRPIAVTNVQGPVRGDELAIELSLASDVALPGGSLRGAVALTELAGRSLRRVELKLHTVESPRVTSSVGARSVHSSTWALCEQTPGEGESLAFDLALPPELSPAFESPFISVTHALEVIAVVPWGRDVAISAPIRIVTQSVSSESGSTPLVGRARNRALWRQAIEETSIPGARVELLEPDVARAVLSVHGLRLLVHETSRGDAPWLRAEVSLPDLALDLRVAERGWTDAFHHLSEIDTSFQQRFSVRCREPAQASSLLDAPVREALLAYDEASLDDQRAEALRRGGVFQLEGLQRFLLEAGRLARALAEAIERMVPPRALADRLEAFDVFARARGARLHRGDLSVRGWIVKGVTIDSVTRFDPLGMSLRAAIPDGADTARWAEALRDAFGPEGSVKDGAAWVRVDIPRDPSVWIAQADRLADVAFACMARADHGPYRR